MPELDDDVDIASSPTKVSTAHIFPDLACIGQAKLTGSRVSSLAASINYRKRNNERAEMYNTRPLQSIGAVLQAAPFV